MLSGYSYKKKLTVSHTVDGAMANYQIMITVNRSAGSDSGNTVYVGTKCATDYDDIRFTKSDRETLLDYWIESSSTSTANIWVELDSIPASGDATFYMYYGNSSATAVSNGDNTFIFFDHFDTTFNTPTKWTSSTEYASVASSILDYSAPAGDYAIYANLFTTQTSFAQRWKANLGTGVRVYIGASKAAPNAGGAALFSLDNDSSHCVYSYNGTNESWDASNWTLNAYKTFDIKTIGNTNSRYFENGVELTASPRTTYPCNGLPSLAIYGNNHTNPILVDWCLMRNFTTNEPLISVWGAEEVLVKKIIGIVRASIKKVLGKSNFSATGGTITNNGTKKIHTFLLANTGTNFVVSGAGIVEVLVVAGGGGGGDGVDYANNGGGGGAGGLIYNTSFSITAGTYSITIGGGGARNTNGSNSIFSTLTAIGGGAGGLASNGSVGGSGGGGAGVGGYTGAAGTSGQGYAGANGGASANGGGGGGGASEVGNTDGGDLGGDGVSNSITGSAVVYAGGGSGGNDAARLAGGDGGGGTGAVYTDASGGGAGTANLGGGGGGGASRTTPNNVPAGVGGSGIVIITYEAGLNQIKKISGVSNI